MKAASKRADEHHFSITPVSWRRLWILEWTCRPSAFYIQFFYVAAAYVTAAVADDDDDDAC